MNRVCESYLPVEAKWAMENFVFLDKGNRMRKRHGSPDRSIYRGTCARARCKEGGLIGPSRVRAQKSQHDMMASKHGIL